METGRWPLNRRTLRLLPRRRAIKVGRPRLAWHPIGSHGEAARSDVGAGVWERDRGRESRLGRREDRRDDGGDAAS
ncbi:hypothetical protein U1Q18_023267 [Sarracenia purpurea var. burkii]